MKKKRLNTEQANMKLNKALDGENQNIADSESLIRENYSKTEDANIKLNNALNGDSGGKEDTIPVVNNSHVPYVLKDNKDDKNEEE